MNYEGMGRKKELGARTQLDFSSTDHLTERGETWARWPSFVLAFYFRFRQKGEFGSLSIVPSLSLVRNILHQKTTMKFSALVLASLAAAVSARGLSADKATGLLAHARRLNDGEEGQQEQEMDLSWAVDFSVKYQGCHHIKQWNNEVDEDADVRILTKRLVRFRLCPSDECSAVKANGCKEGFGDYIVDMDVYLNNYWQAKEADQELGCNNYLAQYCEPDCQNEDDDQVCQAQCMANAGMDYCVENNGNADQEGYDEQQQEEINVEDYFECQQIQIQANGNQENGDGNANGMEYFAGPYCSEQGGAIKIGVFTDDQCTEFAGKTFYQLTGMNMPYSDESLVEDECRSCEQPQEYVAYDNYQNEQENEEYDENMQNDNWQAAETREFCGTLYQEAGKCETYLSDVLGSNYINENACTYMKGIRMVRKDGLLDVSDARPSAVATAFIVIFAMAFAAMTFYVWYLRTRLGVKRDALL